MNYTTLTLIALLQLFLLCCHGIPVSRKAPEETGTRKPESVFQEHFRSRLTPPGLALP